MKNFILRLSLLSVSLLTTQTESREYSDQDLDNYRVQGLYEIETLYKDSTTTELENLNRLAIFKSFDNTTYTISIADGTLNTTYILFSNLTPIFTETEIQFHATGKLPTGRFGEINVKFKRDTLELEGTLRDSSSTGIKHITGKPIYNLKNCIFNQSSFLFPDIGDLIGNYISEDNSTLVLNYYEKKKEISLSVNYTYNKALDKTFPILFDPGFYNQDLGLLSFPIETERNIRGRGNLTYWLDETGESYYLKLFVWGSGGVSFVKKFRKVPEEKTTTE